MAGMGILNDRMLAFVLPWMIWHGSGGPARIVAYDVPDEDDEDEEDDDEDDEDGDEESWDEDDADEEWLDSADQSDIDADAVTLGPGAPVVPQRGGSGVLPRKSLTGLPFGPAYGWLTPL